MVFQTLKHLLGRCPHSMVFQATNNWLGLVLFLVHGLCKSTAGCRLRVSVLEQKIFSWCICKVLSTMEPLHAVTKQGINQSLSQAIVKPALEAVVSEPHC